METIESHGLRDQEALWSAFLAMADAVVLAVRQGVEALCEGRIELVSAVGDAEERSDRDEHQIEGECLRILALYEPVASDLRRLATILKVSRDCERIADRADRIARRARKIARNWGPIELPVGLAPMAREALAMVEEARVLLDAHNPRRARALIAADQAIDLRYREVRRALKARIVEEADHMEVWLQYLGAARNLERIADHAAEIARMIVFLDEGVFPGVRG